MIPRKAAVKAVILKSSCTLPQMYFCALFGVWLYFGSTSSTVLLLSVSFATTTDWTVDDHDPADFINKFQAIVDAAKDGDVIVMMPETYTTKQEEYIVNTRGKAVTLRTSDQSDDEDSSLTNCIFINNTTNDIGGQ